MKLTDEQKQLEALRKAKWVSYADPAKKVVGVFNDNTSMRFANGSKVLKKLTQKMGYKVQYVIN